MRLAHVAAACLLAAAAGRAQNPAPVEAMRRFDHWVGEWKGSGWSMNAEGKRLEFSLSETVERKVGGTVLLIQGRGTGNDGRATPTVTHDGLTVVSFDTKSQRYRWNGYDVASGATDAELTVVDGGVSWSIRPDTRGTIVRFTIRWDERQWNEVGEVSGDGKTWNLFMQMTLTKNGAP